MALFDFLKSRNDQPPVLAGQAEARRALLAMELDLDKKKLTRLRTAGREVEAERAAAEYQQKMEEFCQLTFQAWAELALPVPTSHQAAQICHGIAFLVLPGQAHGEFDTFLSHWRTPAPPFYFALCEQGCAKLGTRPTPEFATAFKKYEAEVNPQCDCFILAFPSPPPYVALPVGELIELMAKAPGEAPILAPYFAAIVHDRAAHRRHYYILNQSSSGGTDLRSFHSTGAETKVGEGPEPTAEAFLNWIIAQHDR